MIRKLPSALEHVQEIAAADSRQLAVFLDYDGTLTPIVSHPEKALLADSMRETVRTSTPSFTPGVTGLISAGPTAFGTRSQPNVYQFLMPRKRSFAKSSRAFLARWWKGNAFLWPRITETCTRTTSSKSSES